MENKEIQIKWNSRFLATVSCYALGSVDTSSSSPFAHGKIYNKGEPLKFPIAVQSDSDDIVDGRELLEAKFHEEWLSPDKRLKNLEKDEQEFKEFDKNQTDINNQYVNLVNQADNSSKGVEALNNT